MGKSKILQMNSKINFYYFDSWLTYPIGIIPDTLYTCMKEEFSTTTIWFFYFLNRNLNSVFEQYR